MSLVTTYQKNSKTVEQQSAFGRINEHFEQLKGQPKALRDFLWKMPKGGDIHHHLLGSVFAEDFLSKAIEEDLWISPSTYHLYFDDADAQSKKAADALLLSSFLKSQPQQREEIIDHWSVRNHQENGRDGRHWFFSAFQKFQPAIIGNEAYFLTKLCKAAAAENVQYLETMVEVPSILDKVAALSDDKDWNSDLSIKDHLEEWYQHLVAKDIDQWAGYNAEVLDDWVDKTAQRGVTLKFQTVGFRVLPHQGTVFAHLLLAFKTALLTDNLVGVNLVAPEDHVVSLSNYNTHMAMISFLKTKYSNVSIALHAGELKEGKGDAQAADLENHIDHAITIAGAQRIGHGVDIGSEERSQQLFAMMRKKGIAVEVNLESNRVILETDSSSHPLKQYLEARVPVCIASDDAGILRTDLTHQFEMLIDYIPDISYSQVKTLVFNSLKYSFLTENDRDIELNKLTQHFDQFERKLIEEYSEN